MAFPAGLEPAASRFGTLRSIRLIYGKMLAALYLTELPLSLFSLRHTPAPYTSSDALSAFDTFGRAGFEPATSASMKALPCAA